MRKIRFVFVFLILAGNAYGDSFWIKGGTLVDPSTKTQTQVDLHVVNGKIHKQKYKASTKERVVQAAGRFLIPGLYDMHVHATFGNPAPGGVYQRLTPQQVANVVLLAGETGFLDLSADEGRIFSARAISRKYRQGADIFAAGPMLTCPGGHGSDLGYPTRTVSSVKEADQQIDDLAKKLPDVIKIAYDHAGEQSEPKATLTPQTLRAVIRAAKRHQLKTIVHIGNWDDAKEAVLAGADVITHLYETDIPDSLIALMKEKKVIEIPTMAYQTDFLHILENRRLLNSPLLSSLIPDSVLAAYRTMDPNEDYSKRVLSWQVRGRDSYPKSLAKLIQAGIPLLCGTDAGDLGTVQGFSVHREMAMMVENGASPWTALDSASTSSKKFLGQPSGIHESELADLVILKGNPIDDINQTQNIETVIHRGKIVEHQKELATLNK